MTQAIIIDSLKKSFAGGTVALDGASLEVERGVVFGFIGPNGAGKTTTIRIMLDLLRPDSGRVLLFGKDPRKDGAGTRHRIGYLPGELRFDERMTAGQALRYLAAIQKKPIAPYVQLAERFDLELGQKIKNLSTGTKQKIGLVQAFAHDPDIVVLDEPTSGLDPLLQKSFQEMLLQRAEQGLTAFVSSHVLSELEEVASEVAFIRQGKILSQSKMEDMQKEALHHVVIHFSRNIPKGFFDKTAGVSGAQYSDKRVEMVVSGSMEAMVKKIGKRAVVSISSEEPDLEEMFLAMYGKGK